MTRGFALASVAMLSLFAVSAMTPAAAEDPDSPRCIAARNAGILPLPDPCVRESMGGSGPAGIVQNYIDFQNDDGTGGGSIQINVADITAGSPAVTYWNGSEVVTARPAGPDTYSTNGHGTITITGENDDNGHLTGSLSRPSWN